MPLVKRYLPLLLGGSLVMILAAGLLFAQVEKGNYEPATLGHLQQPAPPTLTDDAVYQVSPYPEFPLELAEGEGRAQTAGFCGMCHSAHYITMQPPLPAATWAAEVTKMRKVYGAPIPDASAALIIKYLQAHYTPETRKQ